MEQNESQKALARLKEGNEYYILHKQNPAVLDDGRRGELVKNGQSPYAVIITCADSRVAPEHIFSAGLGDLFVIRNAGNVIGHHELGSVEYATEHLGVPLAVVMGHTHCGAVKATIEGSAGGYIKVIADTVRQAIGEETEPRNCERKNAAAGVEKLMESSVISRLVGEGKLAVVSAVYDIETGKVEFIAP